MADDFDAEYALAEVRLQLAANTALSQSPEYLEYFRTDKETVHANSSAAVALVQRLYEDNPELFREMVEADREYREKAGLTKEDIGFEFDKVMNKVKAEAQKMGFDESATEFLHAAMSKVDPQNIAVSPEEVLPEIQKERVIRQLDEAIDQLRDAVAANSNPENDSPTPPSSPTKQRGRNE